MKRRSATKPRAQPTADAVAASYLASPDGTFPFRSHFKLVMPYALFSKDQQISKAFATAQEVWDRAETAGLVEYYEKGGRRRRALAEQYRVKRIPTSGGSGSKPLVQ
jgi:hypothetical protein